MSPEVARRKLVRIQQYLAHRYAEIEGEKVRASIPLAHKTFLSVAREIARIADAI